MTQLHLEGPKNKAKGREKTSPLGEAFSIENGTVKAEQCLALGGLPLASPSPRRKLLRANAELKSESHPVGQDSFSLCPFQQPVCTADGRRELVRA